MCDFALCLELLVFVISSFSVILTCGGGSACTGEGVVNRSPIGGRVGRWKGFRRSAPAPP